MELRKHARRAVVEGGSDLVKQAWLQPTASRRNLLAFYHLAKQEPPSRVRASHHRQAGVQREPCQCRHRIGIYSVRVRKAVGNKPPGAAEQTLRWVNSGGWCTEEMVCAEGAGGPP